MPDPQGLDVNNLKVSQTTRLDAQGNVQRPTVVSYYLGPHGPFTDEFPEGGATATAIKSAILDRQKELRELVMLQSNMV